MGGGGQQGPSKSQIQSQQNQESSMMKMNMQMQQQQMQMQQDMLNQQIEAAERQRLAAEEAARQVAIQSQSTMAQQAAQQNLQDVDQKLIGKNTMQEFADKNAANAYGKSLTTGAENVTGDFNFLNNRRNALQQLGAASGTLPQTDANLLSNIYGLNPAATTAATALNKTGNNKDKNQYNMPNTSDLQFGGT